MKEDLAVRIGSHPKFKELVSKRASFSSTMTVLVMLAYYGYILLIAFDKEFLAQKIGAGVTSVGIPLGVGVILFTIILTALYVRRANKEFDALNEEVVKEVQK
ncbi:MAG: DUF485 domain-containing protein [Betaproteobacteria bacterium]|nr:DUF485 domain-containing protein [Betaproteobacteria bacterium]